jgi:EmrB/QacA subfamily drug resistance transporter
VEKDCQPVTKDTPKNLVLLIAAVASFLTPFMGSAVNVALPVIGRQFGMNAIALSWVATAYLLAAAICLVPIGRLADIHGRKRVFSIGLVVYTSSSLLAAVAPSGWFLIAARVVEGAGAAMIFGTGTAILMSVFPPQERGRALGINVAAVYLGLSLGPTLGGLLTQQIGWRSIFLLNVPLGTLILILIRAMLHGEWAEARGEAFDLLGSLLYGTSLMALLIGVTRLSTPLGMALIVAGMGGIALFVLWELRTASPVLDMRIFRRNRTFALSNLAALINYSATFGVGFLMSLYLQYIKGMTPQQAGLVLVAQPVVQALFSPLTGRLSDRVEPRLVASAGMALTAVGLFSLTRIDAATPVERIIVSLVLLGLGFALFSSPNLNAIMSSVQRRFYGVAAGTQGTMRLIGQNLSMGIVTLVFALVIGQAEITPENHPQFLISVRTDLVILSTLCVVGILASLARGKVR